MDYGELVALYQELELTSKRLEKIEIIARFFKKARSENIKDLVYLIEGRIFPEWDERKIGFSNKLVIKSLSISSGDSIDEINSLFRKKGDLGIVAEELFQKNKRKQSTLISRKIDSEKVLENIRKLSELEGKGTVDRKIRLITELLANANALEAKYIIKLVLENLRIGVSSGIIRDAIAKAFDVSVELVEDAGNLNGDYGEIAELASLGRLEEISLTLGKPVKCMLPIKVDSIEEGFNAVGKPAFIDYKLDGFRVMIQREGENFWFFTRRMENVLEQFKELVPVLKRMIKSKSYIIDSEIVGYDSSSGKYLPFQSISQRIRRKYDLQEMARKFPVEINPFDVIFLDGENLMGMTFKERWGLLEKIVKQKKHEIVIPKFLITDDKKLAEKFYKNALKEGVEGVMMKNLKSLYKPGRYVNGWVKVKSILEPLDLVIVEAEAGEGKRVGWLTSYVIACKGRDGFLTIGKVSTGVKEKGEGVTYSMMTKLLKTLVKKWEGNRAIIKPEVVIEVGYEEIQKSSNYSSGFALRFPRFLRLREDKSGNDVNTLFDVVKFYKKQKNV